MLSSVLFVSPFRNALIPFFFSVLSAFCPARGEEQSMGRIHFSELQSTQIFAKEHAAEFLRTPGKWVVVTADRQTKGMGHQGRKWESFSDGNLYATFVTLYPKNREKELFHVIQVSALSVAKTLQDFCFEPQIKWINDIFLGEKKISGCLCEITTSPLADYYYLLIGIGMNINMTPEELAFIPTPASSMYAEAAQLFDKEAILDILSNHVKASLTSLLEKGFSYFHEEINRLLAFKNELVEVELEPNVVTQGTVLGIDEDGALLLGIPGRGILKIFSGRILRVVE